LLGAVASYPFLLSHYLRLEKQRKRRQQEALRKRLFRLCPECFEEIRKGARVCRFCGFRLHTLRDKTR
jgi:uncharacterized protein (DUF983 family)